ncbi:MAG TPA: NAD(P)H-dependent oxidoreductase [Candidatus Omnitrophota bacterium]|nr:NAD(P)H-dependent oxidoreductase [Candidatus Omnitrophota bacterium]
MKNILHIIVTPRGSESRTLKVSSVFLDTLKKKYPGCKIDELNVFTEKLPELTVKRLDGKYVLLGGKELTSELEKAWEEMMAHINRFLSADAYIISAPMWNFGIPYKLKHYIDVILQPKYLFRYTASGPEGLVKDKKMVIVTSRGGDYSQASPFHAYDFQEPYLKAVLGFVGIKDIKFINAQPMDALGPAVQEEKIKEAQALAVRVASEF